MDFLQLKNKFQEKAEQLAKSKDPTARFRSNAYNRVANKIEAEVDLSAKVTKEIVQTLDISDYMKEKAVEIAEESSRTKKSTVRVGKNKDNHKKDAKRSRSRSRSKSPKTKTVKTASSKTASAKTKDSSKVDEEKLLDELTKFMGIGPEKAKDLVAAGLSHINQLHRKKYQELLPEETKTFMKLKPLQKIPHEHIKTLEPYLMKASSKNLDLTITGSYRRKKPFSSDIDVMVVSDSEDAINELHQQLDEILNHKIYPYSKGRDKMSFIVDMSDLLGGENLVYKIDAFRTTPAEKIPMLLYSTGSKEFNVSMRSKAKKLGYLLNQKGLFKDGELVPELNSERDYFDILSMDYKEPQQRI